MLLCCVLSTYNITPHALSKNGYTHTVMLGGGGHKLILSVFT